MFTIRLHCVSAQKSGPAHGAEERPYTFDFLVYPDADESKDLAPRGQTSVRITAKAADAFRPDTDYLVAIAEAPDRFAPPATPAMKQLKSPRMRGPKR